MTFTMTCRRVVAFAADPGPEGTARRTLQHKLAARKEGRRRARSGAAVAAREAEALDAARHCAEAARAAVSALEQYFDGAELPHAANAKGVSQRSLAGGTPPCAAPPANVRKLVKRDVRTRRRASRRSWPPPRGATRGMRWARTRTRGLAASAFFGSRKTRAAAGGEGAPPAAKNKTPLH